MASVFCLGLAACGAWPDVPSPSGARAGAGWPELVPLSDLTGGRTATGDEGAEPLAERAASLRQRAELMRAPVRDGDAFEALRARLGR
jgi:hypothetical protein